MPAPAWQTPALADEWVEADVSVDLSSVSFDLDRSEGEGDGDGEGDYGREEGDYGREEQSFDVGEQSFAVSEEDVDYGHEERSFDVEGEQSFAVGDGRSFRDMSLDVDTIPNGAFPEDEDTRDLTGLLREHAHYESEHTNSEHERERPEHNIEDDGEHRDRWGFQGDVEEWPTEEEEEEGGGEGMMSFTGVVEGSPMSGSGSMPRGSMNHVPSGLGSTNRVPSGLAPSYLAPNTNRDGAGTFNRMDGAGTFIVHASLAPPRTPGKGRVKDFFTPLKLESMFEPPPAGETQPQQTALFPPPEAQEERTPSPESKEPTPPPSGAFTFVCATSTPREEVQPRPTTPVPKTPARRAQGGVGGQAGVQGGGGGTPLKLFQFTYDTYTREHLSALVDEIAVGGGGRKGGAGRTPGPSGLNPGRTPGPILGRTPGPMGRTPSALNFGRTPLGKSALGEGGVRSAKRVKLSPASEYSGEGRGETRSDVGARIVRAQGAPTPTWRDRAAEARALMEDIRERSVLSTPSASLGNRRTSSTSEGEGQRGRRYANIQNEAASLMAAIKKRVFSGGSDVEASYYHEPGTLGDATQTTVASTPPQPRVPSTSSQSTQSRVSSTTSDSSPLALRVPSTTTTASSSESRVPSTTSTIPSYAKHPGPPALRTIRPADVRDVLGERVGDMVFDPVRGCWVREGGGGGDGSWAFGDEDSREEAGAVEASREGSEERVEEERPSSEAEQERESEGDEGWPASSPSWEGSASPSPAPSPEESESESEEEEDEGSPTVRRAIPIPMPASFQPLPPASIPAQSQSQQLPIPTQTQPPLPSSSSQPLPPPTPRSVLKQHHERRRRKRRSVSFSDGRMEGPIRDGDDGESDGDEGWFGTGLAGEEEVRGLGFGGFGGEDEDGHGEEKEGEGQDGDEREREGDGEGEGEEPEGRGEGWELSARSRRLGALVDDVAGDGDGTDASSSHHHHPPPQDVSSSQHSDISSPQRNISSASQHQHQHPDISSASQHPHNTTMPSFVLTHDALTSALTEVEPYTLYWDRLVRLELGWPFVRRVREEEDDHNASGVTAIIAGSGSAQGLAPLSSLARLSEFTPRLLELDVSGNAVAYLTGVPQGVRVLEGRGCLLGDTCGWGGVRGLERVDVTGQRGGVLRGLRQLACLTKLTVLHAANNAIRSLDGIRELRCLVEVDLSGNRIGRDGTGVDLTTCEWPRLEVLKLNDNGPGMGTLRVGVRPLVHLEVEGCGIGVLLFEGARTWKLRTLKASRNELRSLDVSMLGCLRVLYADGCLLGGQNGGVIWGQGGGGQGVEVVSLREQGGDRRGQAQAQGPEVPGAHGLADARTLANIPRDVRRLYLSGTLRPPFPCTTTCYYSLTYLELARCGLTEAGSGVSGVRGGCTILPPLATLTPNVRSVNLNYNFFESVGVLSGCGRVRRVSFVGNRVGSGSGSKRESKKEKGSGNKESGSRSGKGSRMRALVADLRAMGDELEDVDLRGNPCVAGWYLPINQPAAYPHPSSATHPSSHPSHPHQPAPTPTPDLDTPWRRSLPDSVYAGRLLYRGLVMAGAPRLRVLDGVVVTRKEREKAGELVRRLGGRG